MADKLAQLIERLNAWRTAPLRVRAWWLPAGLPVKVSRLSTSTVPLSKK